MVIQPGYTVKYPLFFCLFLLFTSLTTPALAQTAPVSKTYTYLI